ncbi:VOC family protein [Nocardioides litoris]|uniref:VOC family protein n=1 Tax=Nocardioides litoris TaxID=1926648 RepID=UPI001120208C|nr:VOC family protein [Nocardioides litoris]
MTVQTTTHLNFRGTARAALEHYHSVFGGDLFVATHAEAYPEPGVGEADLVAFGQVTSPTGFRVMAFDVPSARAWERGQDSFWVSVRGDDADELTRSFEGLAQGGTVLVPLGPSGWSPLYGLVVDAYGVTWVVDQEVAYQG